jgi:hypothetical protein
MNFFSSSSDGDEKSKGSGSGIGGWLSSLQEKSKTLVEVYKRDLGCETFLLISNFVAFSKVNIWILQKQLKFVKTISHIIMK